MFPTSFRFALTCLSGKKKKREREEKRGRGITWNVIGRILSAEAANQISLQPFQTQFWGHLHRYGIHWKHTNTRAVPSCIYAARVNLCKPWKTIFFGSTDVTPLNLAPVPVPEAPTTTHKNSNNGVQRTCFATTTNDRLVAAIAVKIFLFFYTTPNNRLLWTTALCWIDHGYQREQPSEDGCSKKKWATVNGCVVDSE